MSALKMVKLLEVNGLVEFLLVANGKDEMA